MTNSVKFDPGIGSLAIDFNEYINNFYSSLMSLNSIHQKRARFKMYSSKILNYMKNNIAFYLGCLLWAYYISENNKNKPIEIDGNPFADFTKEQLEEFDYLIQVNFLNNYFDSYERDSVYYTCKKIIIPEKWKNIVNTYYEFLELNKGFTNTKLTSDIVLPEIIKNMKIDFNIEEKINEVINNKSPEILLNIENLPF